MVSKTKSFNSARKYHKVPVWRARYFGEWPNLNPLPWLHAYHYSDIPMIFGTAQILGPSTRAEVETSNTCKVHGQPLRMILGKAWYGQLMIQMLTRSSNWASKIKQKLILDRAMSMMSYAE